MVNALPHAPLIPFAKTTSQTLAPTNSSPKSLRSALFRLNLFQIQVLLSPFSGIVLESGVNQGFPCQLQVVRCVCTLAHIGLSVPRWSGPSGGWWWVIRKIRKLVKLVVMKDFRKRKKALFGVGGGSMIFWLSYGAWSGLGGAPLRLAGVVWLLLFSSAFLCAVLVGFLTPDCASLVELHTNRFVTAHEALSSLLSSIKPLMNSLFRTNEPVNLLSLIQITTVVRCFNKTVTEPCVPSPSTPQKGSQKLMFKLLPEGLANPTGFVLLLLASTSVSLRTVGLLPAAKICAILPCNRFASVQLVLVSLLYYIIPFVNFVFLTFGLVKLLCLIQNFTPSLGVNKTVKVVYALSSYTSRKGFQKSLDKLPAVALALALALDSPAIVVLSWISIHPLVVNLGFPNRSLPAFSLYSACEVYDFIKPACKPVLDKLILLKEVFALNLVEKSFDCLLSFVLLLGGYFHTDMYVDFLRVFIVMPTALEVCLERKTKTDSASIAYPLNTPRKGPKSRSCGVHFSVGNDFPMDSAATSLPSNAGGKIKRRLNLHVGSCLGCDSMKTPEKTSGAVVLVPPQTNSRKGIQIATENRASERAPSLDECKQRSLEVMASWKKFWYIDLLAACLAPPDFGFWPAVYSCELLM